jgi:3-methyladenine DNA glycosylase/8-oxoguanine DNA glycosylase
MGPVVSLPAVERRLEAPVFYDLDESLRFVPLGAHDPSCRRGPGVLWKAARTPAGPVALELRRESDGLRARAFGPGADWTLARADALFGLRDEPRSFAPPGGRLAILARRGRGLHLPRSPFVFDVLTGVILQQRVAWRDAARAHRRLTAAFGEAAPGPWGLKLPLAPRQWLALSGEHLRRAGIDGQRARALRAAARQARTVDAVFDRPFQEARARLAAVPGCGPWTVEMTLAFGLGDPDAVIPGDLHLPRLVAWALAGETEANDQRMLALLEPYRGHRFRLIRLFYAAGIGASFSSRARASRS